MSASPARAADDDALVAALVRLVRAGDAEGVIDALVNRPEKGRAELAVRVHRGLRLHVAPATPQRSAPADQAYAIATVCLQPADEAVWAPQIRRDDETTRVALGQIARAAASRPPAWRARFVLLLSGPALGAFSWSVISRLAEAGAVEPPVAGTHLPALWSALTPMTLASAIAHRPVVREEAWASFRVDGTSSRLWIRDGVTPALWWNALFNALEVDRPEGRDRLLGECLVRLQAVRTAPEARLPLDLLEHLSVQDAELAQRQGGYLALLNAPVPGAVAVAQAALQRLLTLGALDGDALLELSQDVLRRREKGIVKAQLRLLAAAIDGGALPLADAADVLCRALDPARADLAVGTAKVLRRCVEHLPPAGQDAVRELVATQVVEPWPELAAALGPELVRTTVGGPGGARSGAFRAPVDLPAPDEVTAVRDADELCELIAHVLEHPEDAIGVEVALAGMVRWRDVRPVAADAVVRRASDRSWAWPERSFGTGFANVVVKWLEPSWLERDPLHLWVNRLKIAPIGFVQEGWTEVEGDVPAGAEVSESRWRDEGGATRVGWRWKLAVRVNVPSVLQQARFREVQGVMADPSPCRLLATPSRSDGSLDGATLLRRLSEGRGRDDLPAHDLAVALLRLNPADHAGVLASMALPPAAARQLETLALPREWHRQTTQVQVGDWALSRGQDRASLWRRVEHLDEPPLDWPGCWSDTSKVAATWTLSTDYIDQDTSFGADLGAWALTLPHDPDLLSVHLQPFLAFWLDKPRASFVAVAHALGATRTRHTGPSASALVWLSAFKDVTVRSAAAEAIASAAQRGTLTGGDLGAQLVDVVGPDAGPFVPRPNLVQRGPRADGPKLARVASTLGDASRLGDAAEAIVLDALTVMLPVLHNQRGGAELVELAAVSAEHRRVRVPLPDQLAVLAARSPSTRIAAAVRRLSEAGA